MLIFKKNIAESFRVFTEINEYLFDAFRNSPNNSKHGCALTNSIGYSEAR